MTTGPGLERSEIAASILSIAGELLDAAVTEETNFFDAGGTSLICARFAIRLGQAFGVRVGVVQILTNPVFGDLADAVARQLAETAPA